MDIFRKKLGFYSCTVPSFEQHTLERFISRGYFEKHINRMRKFYQTRRNRVVRLLEGCPWAEKLTILERDAGLHFLLRVDTDLSDRELCEGLARSGIRIHPLSHYYHGDQIPDTHCQSSTPRSTMFRRAGRRCFCGALSPFMRRVKFCRVSWY